MSRRTVKRKARDQAGLFMALIAGYARYELSCGHTVAIKQPAPKTVVCQQCVTEKERRQ